MNGAGETASNAIPGTVVSGRLRLDHWLGEGATGGVWKGMHLELGIEVAVKVMSAATSPGLGGKVWSERAVDHFLAEAELAQRVECPHVVHMIECGLSKEIGPYVAMEYLDGLHLGEHVDRFGPMDIQRAATVAAQLCAGLQALHEADVYHRDVKPDNVVLRTLGNASKPCATLIDFGIALDGRAPPESVRPDVVGTPAYMSPERLMGSPSPPVLGDLWSAAVIAYQCLLARLPFDDSTLGNLCVAVHRGTFTRPGSIRRDVPPMLDAWFDRALDPRASQRFTSAAEMREALIEACAPFDLFIEAPDGALPPSERSGEYLRMGHHGDCRDAC